MSGSPEWSMSEPEGGIPMEWSSDSESAVPDEPLELDGDVRQKYCKLIQNCQGMKEQDVTNSKSIAKMRIRDLEKNLEAGVGLFDEIGSGPGEMYLAFLHTEACTGVMKQKVDELGHECKNEFNLDKFLNTLVEKFTDKDGNYSAKLALKSLSNSAANLSKALSPVQFMPLPDYDRTLLTEEDEKKAARDPRRRKTHLAGLRTTSEPRNHLEVKDLEVLRKENAESVTIQLRRGLPGPDLPVNFFEYIVEYYSFQGTIERLFHLTLLVRDGEAGLVRDSECVGKEINDASLCVVSGPGKASTTSQSADRLSRRSLIVSFSAKKWKAMKALYLSEQNEIAELDSAIGPDIGLLEGLMSASSISISEEPKVQE